MASFQQQGYMASAFQIMAGYAPAWMKGKGGPKALTVPFDFTAATTISFDLFKEAFGNQLDFVQSAFIDNSQNAQSLTLSVGVTQQRIIVAPQSQAVLPILSPRELTGSISTTGAVIVPILFMNVPLPFAVWSTVALSVSVSVATETLTDKSGTIAAGDASQVVIAANANRKQLIVQNPTTEQEILYLNFGAAAAPGSAIELTPGQIWTSGAGPISTQSINVRAHTLGHVFICKEGA